MPERVRRYPLDAAGRRARRLTYDVAANWKVLAENYNECYHCGPVHPELCRLVPAFGGGGAGPGLGRTASRTARAPGRSPLSGTSDRAPFPDLDDDERVRHKGELVYPNLLLSLSADHVAAFTLSATGGRTAPRSSATLLFAPDEVAERRLRPLGRRRLLGPGQPAGLGDLRVGAARHVLAGLHAGAGTPPWRTPSLDIRRWLLPRLGEDGDREAADDE